MVKLFDDELSNVSGGVMQANKDLDTYGKSIQCPNGACGGTIMDTVYKDTKEGFESELYMCTCGAKFVVYKNRVIMRDNWTAECKKYKYDYIYANV